LTAGLRGRGRGGYWAEPDADRKQTARRICALIIHEVADAAAETEFFICFLLEMQFHEFSCSSLNKIQFTMAAS